MECEVGTIRQIHRRLREEGCNIGESTLRGWVKDGTLPAIPVGNRALISYENVRTILRSIPVAK